MARLKINSDILSPIQADGTFSFGSLASTPDSDIASPIGKYIEKDSDISSFCKSTMKQNEDVFEVIVNDIKRQSNINAEKEEKFKDTYKILQQQMDELFYKKASYSSIISPISKDAELENITDARDADSNIDKIDEGLQNVKVYRKSSTSRPKTCSQISSKGIERSKKQSSNSVNREQKSAHHLKNIRPLKLSANDTDAELFDTHKTKTSKTATTITQISKSNEAKGTASKQANKKGEVKEHKTAKAFPFKSQQKIAVSNIMPSIENKSLCIEKTIQIAVGMEMDKLRCFILDQNLGLNKALLNLQDMARKQTEVTGHLFSLVDELLEANMKLISKQK